MSKGNPLINREEVIKLVEGMIANKNVEIDRALEWIDYYEDLRLWAIAEVGMENVTRMKAQVESLRRVRDAVYIIQT